MKSRDWKQAVDLECEQTSEAEILRMPGQAVEANFIFMIAQKDMDT